MSRRHPARRAIAVPVLFLAPWLWLGCGSAPPPPQPGGVQGWIDGPTRWLMLPEEERQARRLHSNKEAVAFIETFWRRRDSDPAKHGSRFAQVFYQRVDAADRLYGEEDVRGSMTDRGRALILLGPPPMLAYSQKPVPERDLGRLGSRAPARTRRLVLKTWTFEEADLTPQMVALLAAGGRPPMVALVFAVEPRHTTLLDGGKLLDLAVRAAVYDEGKR